MLRDDAAFFRLLHAAKYEGRAAVLAPLATAFGLWAAPFLRPWSETSVVPVPDDPRRRRERGGSSAELLARAVSQAAALPLGLSWLTRRRGVPPLARLRGAHARRNALRGVMGVGRIAEARRGSVLVLVDDQVTTGSTLAAAARLLTARGHRVLALALAGAAAAPRELDLDTRGACSLESTGSSR
jgi:predicted amidophosphoribosyltransferase